MLAMNKTIQINYFALFREQRGLSQETIDTAAETVGQLYEELQSRHCFTLSKGSLRAALNDEFCQWDSILKAGDRIVFIPPVAGG
jgi:molybdopterin converting factor subunit 1